MAVQLYAPGVYVDEVPSPVRTVAGVSTSVTAFIGVAARGPVNTPTSVYSQGEFDRVFGGLFAMSEMSYAVQHFFQNGGSEAVIVRVVHRVNAETELERSAKVALVWLAFDGANVCFVAADPGTWGNTLRLSFVLRGGSFNAGETFDLTISQDVGGRVTPLETWFGLSLDTSNVNYVRDVLAHRSTVLRVDATAVAPGAPPIPTVSAGPIALTDGSDGSQPRIAAYSGVAADATGLWALQGVESFNLLCVPFPLTTDRVSDADRVTFWQAAIKYCRDRRAFAIIDPAVGWGSYDQLMADLATNGVMTGLRSAPGRQFGAVYFPRVRSADPLDENRMRTFQPSGMVAGIMARTDAARGVWKAPAGVEATLVGSLDLDVVVNDIEQGQLNDEGVNVLRGFPAYGRLIWGARTIDGIERLGSEWKYVPVRRTANFIEDSLLRGTKWAIFEPNDEALWAQLRLNVGAFMHRLFREGAFAGTSAREAYFVKCDSETTTQADIDQGVVTVVVGWAPLRPAEFVILRIQQIAGAAGV